MGSSQFGSDFLQTTANLLDILLPTSAPHAMYSRVLTIRLSCNLYVLFLKDYAQFIRFVGPLLCNDKSSKGLKQPATALVYSFTLFQTCIHCPLSASVVNFVGRGFPGGANTTRNSSPLSS
jgi:hypothetical protein